MSIPWLAYSVATIADTQSEGRQAHLAAFVLKVESIQQVHCPHRDQCVHNNQRHSCPDPCQGYCKRQGGYQEEECPSKFLKKTAAILCANAMRGQKLCGLTSMRKREHDLPADTGRTPLARPHS